MTPRLLSIAGSDSGAGAGIQADLKTCAAHGVYACTAITALTAQNTRGVSAILPSPAAIIAAQIDAVMQDFEPHTWKTGMLGSSEAIHTISERARYYAINQLIVDPVVTATSGADLLPDNSLQSLISELLPLSYLITPNVQEAALLAQQTIHTLADMQKAAIKIHALGAQHVLVKGGDFNNDEQAIDIFYDGKQHHQLSAPRIQSLHTHGTGCTLSAAIAAQLAKGQALLPAIKAAKNYVSRAIIAGQNLQLGSGRGPLQHFTSKPECD